MITPNIDIPAVQYLRPNGTRNPGVLTAEINEEERDLLTDKLALLKEIGIEITLEEIHGLVSVCLDDGDFDYQTRLFSNNEELPAGVVALVREFDIAHYERVSEAVAASE